MDVIKPHMLVDGDLEAMEFARWPGTYDSTHTGNEIYEEGDLVLVDANGKVARAAGNAANTAAAKLYLAGQSWDQPFALDYLLAKGVPLNEIPKRNRFVFTLQGDAADGADSALVAGDILDVQQGAARDIAWNDTAKALTVRDTSATPKCILKGFFKPVNPEAGDLNVRVLVELLPEAQ